jgi:hypothetical protein
MLTFHTAVARKIQKNIKGGFQMENALSEQRL